MTDKGPFPADYCIVGNSPQDRLSQFERLTLTGGRELRRALSWITRGLVSVSVESSIGAFQPATLQQALDFYYRPEWRSDPSSFFELPAGLPQYCETPIHGLYDGQVSELQFNSGYVPQHPSLIESYACDSSLTNCQLRVWRHADEKRPTIIAIHGWNIPDHRLHALTLLPGFFFREGFNVALYELPYHGRRLSAASKSKPPFPSLDFIRTNEAFGQVIWELRQLRHILNDLCASEVGVLGSSLGGYCSALWAGLDRLSFCVPIVPLVKLDDFAYSALTRSGAQMPDGARRQFEHLFSIHSPLSYSLRSDRQRALIVAGKGDRVIRRAHIKRLERAWGKPRLIWARGGHAAQVDDSNVFLSIVSFLKELPPDSSA